MQLPYTGQQQANLHSLGLSVGCVLVKAAVARIHQASIVVVIKLHAILSLCVAWGHMRCHSRTNSC
jgi:hypothetical protein